MQSTILSKRQGTVTGEMEKSLKLRTKDQYRDIPINISTIQVMALSLYDYWKKCLGASAANTLEIHATKVWFNRFKNKVQLHNIRLSGESASANKHDSLKFVKKFAKSVEEGAILLIKLLMLMRQD
jgi:hypothetical protein